MAVLKREKALEIALHTLRSAGVEGVMVDVWWGICERAGPRMYDFSAYKRLFHKCAAAGLRVQVRLAGFWGSWPAVVRLGAAGLLWARGEDGCAV